MKIAKLAVSLALLAAASAEALAGNAMDCKPRNDPMNLLTDVMVIRPMGAVVTVAGFGLFMGTSPLSALASIPEPHDAFQRVGGWLVGAPYAYTFVRPLGEFGNTCRYP